MIRAISRKIGNDVKIQDDHEVDEAEQVTRFGCGALLGIFVGIGVIVAFTLTSFGLAAAALVGSMIVCGWFALIYGDSFWHALKDLWS